MSTVFQTRIESYEVQPNDIIRPSTLFHLFQKAAGDDLDARGMTYNFLRENGIVFVVTKFTLEYFADIHSNDHVTMATYPRGVHGVSFIRDFDVTLNGTRAAYATSSWVLLDINHRTLLRPNAIDRLGKIQPDLSDMHEIEDRRIKFNTAEMNKTDVREVYYSQIDRNGHMNNTFYPDIVYDYFPNERKSTDIGKKFSIYYASEVMCGEKFEVYTAEKDGEFHFVAKNPTTGKDIFSALIDF